MNNPSTTESPDSCGLNATNAAERLPAPQSAWANHTPVFLVGMMGAGKTTIGKSLAKALNREFLDLDILADGQRVMATGGGAVLALENRSALRTRGVVVYLRASVEELYRRTSRDRNRPLLATADPRATLRSLLELREPLYREVADIVMDTGSTSVAQLVAQLVERLKQIDKAIDQQAQRHPENSSENMRADFTASHPPENKPCTP